MSLQTGLLEQPVRLRGALNPARGGGVERWPEYTAHVSRWWVLAVYALVGASQCCNWCASTPPRGHSPP